MSAHREELERPVSLSEVSRLLDEAGLLGEAPSAAVEVRGVTADSRLVQPGDLFCAWRGTRVDAHDLVPAAVEAGAVAVTVERSVETVVPQIVVSDGRRAASVVAMRLLEAGTGLRLVGVTGTNGKTTTTWILSHLMEDGASIGTLGVRTAGGETPYGEEVLTTPGPVELAGALRALAREGARVVAMELSSHALDQGRGHGVGLDVAVFTTFGRDHLDYHATERAYLDAKRALMDRLRPEGAVVVNAEEPAWDGLAEAAERGIRYAVENGGGRPETSRAQVRARALALDARGADFELVSPYGAAQIRLPLLGRHNVQNALAAAAAALALDTGFDTVPRRLATVPQVPGRVERIADRPCAVLRDYAHTPDALENVLTALRPLVSGRLIVVFGAGGDRDRGKRPVMGRVVARLADLPVVTSDNPRTEDPGAIVADIVAGMPATERLEIVDRREAIARALELAEPDDMVLLAGKGHETYQVVGTERRPFDEAVVVAELLAGGPP